MQGATIKDLHNTWSFGSSISAIVLNLKYFNLAALAAVVTKLTIVDGVLFQRSTTTYVALGLPHDHNITTFPTKFMPLTARLNQFGNDTGKNNPSVQPHTNGTDNRYRLSVIRVYI